MSGRTIVVSDLHGYAALLENTLADAGFGGDDRLIAAGDLVDIGPDDCIAAAEWHRAVILAGNHEVSAALDVDIFPQNPETPARGPEFAQRFLSGEWPLAAAVDGWLVTHGGLSVMFDDDVKSSAGDIEQLAERLNEAFRAEMTRYLEGEISIWSLGRSRILGSELGPLWFRAGRPDLVARGVRQVVGHTPCELFSESAVAELAHHDFLLIDPGAHLEPDPRGRVRYAIIENGAATVVNACV